jgi:hypothetical protein
MLEKIKQLDRTQLTLGIIILMTLPCYCAGMILLWNVNLERGQKTPTTTLTPEITKQGSITPTFTLPAVTQTVTMTPTITTTFTPTITYKLPPTRTPSPSPTLTETPIPTATLTNTPVPLPSLTPTETLTETLESSQTP